MDLYPGVDMVLSTDSQTWRLEGRPRGDTSRVHLHVEGSEPPTLDGRYLRSDVTGNQLTLPLPAADFPST